MLLAQALAGVTAGDQDCQPVLPFLGIQADIFGLLLTGIVAAADSSVVLLCLRRKNKMNKLYSGCNTSSKETDIDT